MNRLTPDQQQTLTSLMMRVPFSSLIQIISLLVACVAIIAAGFAALITKGLLPPELKDVVSYVCVVTGFVAFGGWSLLPRRKEYRKKFQEMLSRQPLVTWQYTDAEWKAWLELIDDLNYPRLIPRKMIYAGILFGVPLGLYRAVTHEQGTSPGLTFLYGFGFTIVVCSAVAWLFYQYWMHLYRAWQQAPSETKIFANGVFFHHRFVDWQGSPDKTVMVNVESEDAPIATLVVTTEGTGDGLAPQLHFMAPIPADQLEQAKELALALSQNTEQEAESTEES